MKELKHKVDLIRRDEPDTTYGDMADYLLREAKDVGDYNPK